MKLEKIYESLCVHDTRNEFYQDMIAAGEPPEDMPAPRVDCYCDNCFYGKDELALEILRLREALQNLVEDGTDREVETGIGIMSEKTTAWYEAKEILEDES